MMIGFHNYLLMSHCKSEMRFNLTEITGKYRIVWTKVLSCHSAPRRGQAKADAYR